MAGVMMLLGSMAIGMYLGSLLTNWACPRYQDILFYSSQAWTVQSAHVEESRFNGIVCKSMTIKIQNPHGGNAQIVAEEWGSAYNHYLGVKRGDILIFDIGKGMAAYKGLTVTPPAFEYLDLAQVVKK